jgi:hypothetical protein
MNVHVKSVPLSGMTLMDLLRAELRKELATTFCLLRDGWSRGSELNR